MRCAKFERTPIKPSPISPTVKCVLPITTPLIPTPQAELAPRSRRSSRSEAKNLAAPPELSSGPQAAEIASALKNKLISPITAVTAPIKMEAVTRGQSTKSQDTLISEAHTTAKAAPKAAGGRHPHPPTGSNKKLKHVCPFDGCSWRFATPYKLRRHIKSHTKETPYVCKECGRGFSVRYNLLMHIQTIHSQPQKFKCPVRGCKDAFHSQARLNGHLRKIHKKDVKAVETQRMNSRGNSTSSMESVGDEEVTTTVARNTRQRRKHECSECGKEFTTQAKLNVHARTHSEGKPFKCTAEGCEETFLSKEALLKHSSEHKNGRQFTCPHKNCNRVFLHQSHLKNHLKIHTKDHQFVCPVLDCSMKFGSESEYSTHLNTHINYGYKCTYPGCDLSFLSKKRLAFHSQVVHGMHNGAQSSFLEGIQPHLGVNYQSSQLLSPLPSPVFTYTHLPHDPSNPLNYAPQDFIKDIDLPGHSQKHFETILNQNKNWSGEQIDHFLHSAVDLSEMEATLFSSTGYESDSGYSTYDVSPIATNPPLINPMQSLPPASHIQHAAGPMLNPSFAFSPGAPVFHDGPHSAASSPCSTEVGFFSPQTDLDSMATTPSQNVSFFATREIPSHGVHMYPPQPMLNVGYYPEPPTTSLPTYLNSRIPDVLTQSEGHLEGRPGYLGCRRKSDSQVNFGESPRVSREQLVTRSLPNMGQLQHMIKTEHPFNECSAPLLPMNNATVKKEEDKRRHSCSMAAPLVGQPPQTSQSSIESTARSTTMKATKKPKTNKTGPRRKNQWPRSMNKANMMAFRQHILNKLKKGQETLSEHYAIKQEAGSPKAMSDPEFGMQNSDTESYEVQVKVQRNHSSDDRSHSEPIEGSNSPTLPVLQTSLSNSDVSKDTTPVVSVEDTNTSHLTEIFSDDIFNTFSFNPDSLLSGADEEQMLKTLGFTESDDEIAAFLGVGSNSMMSARSSSSEVMDLDCIQEILENDDISSPLSIPTIAEPALDSTIFGGSPSPNLSPVSNGSPSPISSQPVSFSSSYSLQATPHHTIFVGNVEDSLSISGSAVYHSQPAPLFGTCQEFGTCVPEVFDI